MIGAEHETPRPPAGPAFNDAVTVAFGDEEAALYGLLRVGLSGDPTQASGLALLFDGGDVAAAGARGQIALVQRRFDPPELEGLAVETVAPLSAWRARFEGDEGGFELELTALSPPLELSAEDPVARAAGSEGYEQLCRVEGVVRTGGDERRVSCLGQRGHGWGIPDWERLELVRTVSAWLAEDRAFTLAAVRPAGASDHAQEEASALLLEDRGEGPVVVPVAQPRLSTTYDAEGRQRRAGLELWETEEAEYPRRLAGEAVCGTSLDLGRLRLQCAFFRWSMEDRSGVGRYDVLRRA